MLTRYGGLYDQHANRTAPYSVREGVSSLLEAPSIKQDGRKDCLEERIQHANMAWWRDVKIHRSNDVPSRVKCRRMVEHVYSVFCFGSEKVGPGVKPSWTESKDGKQKGHEVSLFRFKQKDDENFIGYWQRTPARFGQR